MFEKLLPQLTDYAVKIVGVLFAIWVSFKVGAWLGGRIEAQLKARKFDVTLSTFFGSVMRWLIVVAAVVACLGVFGIETTSFAAIIGAAGLAIGLAFQGTLGNFASGVLLLTFRPFGIGDLVKIGGELGVVAEIGLFTVSLDTPDGRRIVIPNSAVTSGTIENITHNDKRRVDIDVGVEYSADIEATREVLDKAAASVEGRLEKEGHQVIVLSLGDSSVNWQVRVWCMTADYWAVWERTLTAVKKHLDEAEIGIPFPQMDVHLPKDAAPAPARLGIPRPPRPI
jgi:small conductance mechanosensitive channel